MYNAKYIIPGILFFLALIFVPVGYNMGKSFDVKPELPKDQKDCIEDVQVMRDKHMQILNDWRNSAVRDGERIYVNSKGKKYVKSLTNTCLGCHKDKAKFCDRCHDTVGVNPYCFDCHNITPNQKSPIPPAQTGEEGGH
ncbi:sulfate reduction electron transfer complex DsrMKJOP subunit DsrJ [Desulfovibrio sp. JY]|nr:sulfate reduction electron transfer complex DsrMKJOP subunit DsrJ [Desulfovibrio sp. JY]